MVVWSILARCASQNLKKSRVQSNFALYNAIQRQTQVRSMSDHMILTATRWQWHKTKDLVYLYFLIAAIPLGIITFLVNIYVGPATLTEIPENYVPKHWEYHRHPITRFLARYYFENPQKDYEKTLALIFDEGIHVEIRKLEKKIFSMQRELQDYKYYYYQPVSSTINTLRENREIIRRNQTGIDDSHGKI